MSGVKMLHIRYYMFCTEFRLLLHAGIISLKFRAKRK